MTNIKLPIDYNKITWQQRKEVRERYIKLQGNICFFCNSSLNTAPKSNILNKKINWSLFPAHFLKHPVHLQHNHKTGMTEGAVHAYCNAVMWQYYGR